MLAKGLKSLAFAAKWPKDPCALFSTSSRCRSYIDTGDNLKIGAHTRVIFQGFTGRQATQNAKQSLEYGTQIVGGVTPSQTGEHLGLPVLPSVRAAKHQLKPDATAVYVAANKATEAIEEAIEAEIPLIVAVAEHIPIHQQLRIQRMLRSQSVSRLVGANSPGMISATGRCRLGFHPLPCFQTGCVGIVAKSGTLSYEAVASTTRAGLGQSLVIGMGGDPFPGTDFVDALKVFEHDKDTKGIVLIGEIGGDAEDRAAEWIRAYRKRTTKPKPIAALIAGLQATRGTIMGHAGAVLGPGENDARRKANLLQDAGAGLVYHPSLFGEVMASLLDDKDETTVPDANSSLVRQAMLHPPTFPEVIFPDQLQKSAPSPRVRSNMLSLLHQRHYAFPVSLTAFERDSNNTIKVTFTFDRRKSESVIKLDLEAEDISTSEPLISLRGPVGRAFESLRIQSRSCQEHLTAHQRQILSILKRTRKMYEFWQLRSLTAWVTVAPKVTLFDLEIELDDAAVRIDPEKYVGIKKALAADGHTGQGVAELDASKHGIVYLRLPGPGRIGTLVNGAGLAMNTVDALTLLNDSAPICANFLDTGGKATSETVKQSFQTILQDERVKSIFVNIFGGLTLCDMIAKGILLAYKDLGIQVPVVVRLRGTNEEEGQKIIAESGLPLQAFDDFHEAASKVIELSHNT